MSYSFIMGFLVGLVIVAIVTVILRLALNNEWKIKGEYDERQQLVRGRGYKYSFFTLLLCVGVILTLSTCYVNMVLFRILSFTACGISICVYATYAIWHDAYFGVNARPKLLLIYSAIIGFGNLLIGLIEINEVHAANLICAGIFLWICLVILVKKFIQRETE